MRELAVGLAPGVRVNGISPATVVKGSTMFPRDRVTRSLQNTALHLRSRQAMRSFVRCLQAFTQSGR